MNIFIAVWMSPEDWTTIHKLDVHSVYRMITPTMQENLGVPTTVTVAVQDGFIRNSLHTRLSGQQDVYRTLYQTQVVQTQQFQLQQNITNLHVTFDAMITDGVNHSLNAIPQVSQDDWRAIANFDACYTDFVSASIKAHIQDCVVPQGPPAIANGGVREGGAAEAQDLNVPPPGGNQGHAVDGLPQGQTHNPQEHNRRQCPL